MRLLSEPGHRLLVIRKVAKTLRTSVYAQLVDVINEWQLPKLFRPRRSSLEIDCLNGGQVICAGLDDSEKLKSIAGITGVWIEEASELTPEDFAQIDLRLRGRTPYYKQIILSFNPISVLNWLKPRFFDQPDRRARVLKTTYLDNRFIDDEYAATLEGLKDRDEVYYRVYALGEWGVLGNLVYTNYVVEDIPTEDSYYPSVSAGLDFGYNDPAALLKLGLRDNELYAYSEFYQARLTNPELIQRIKPVVGNAQVYADSSEPARIKEARQAGLHMVGATKGPDSIKAGIDFVRARRLHIHPNCVNAIAEIQGYKYRQDKDGNVLETPVDFRNHLMDALRYGSEPWRAGRRAGTWGRRAG